MASRLNLHEEFCELLGNRNVYFQPPESVKLSYPCIVYNLAEIEVNKADNRPYKKDTRYTVTLMHKNPDNTIKETMLDHFTYCEMDTCFSKDGLNHYVYDLYY